MTRMMRSSGLSFMMSSEKMAFDSDTQMHAWSPYVGCSHLHSWLTTCPVFLIDMHRYGICQCHNCMLHFKHGTRVFVCVSVQ